ncbi:MAG: flagellar protein FlaG [Amphritea sp.]|nr:flagellar protein FlaG [Amphritea sp.]
MSNELTITGAASQSAVQGRTPAAEAAKPQPEQAEVGRVDEGVQKAETAVQVDAETLREVIGELNELVKKQARELQFAIDDGTGQVVVKVIESTTQDLVRQIPSEEFLRLVEHFNSGDNGGLMEVVV